MFQTALPFGYLIQFLLLLAGGVTTFVLLLRGWRRRDRTLLRAGAAVGAVLAGVAALAAARPGIDEWNPYPIRGDVLLGRWVDGARSLELRADRTFTLRDGQAAAVVGRYGRDDWNLRLEDAGGRALPPLRVVEAGGEYRIIVDPDEPDTWDGSLHYRHAPPARVR